MDTVVTGSWTPQLWAARNELYRRSGTVLCTSDVFMYGNYSSFTVWQCCKTWTYCTFDYCFPRCLGRNETFYKHSILQLFGWVFKIPNIFAAFKTDYLSAVQMSHINVAAVRKTSCCWWLLFLLWMFLIHSSSNCSDIALHRCLILSCLLYNCGNIMYWLREFDFGFCTITQCNKCRFSFNWIRSVYF